ncbi:hypothetical protein [Mesorhizobium sp.]|uniref:hypothetical protein n=1 Tax=Mesorhizobium sp. TaxID=1871066 RepID=UPI000FE37130|nr:hypothetical protein [Mesorhizobium sp.]RWG79921.1 MAG: hypothetical protein EOQ69_22675 [Mesorhizobium sp.]RWG81311.1 MAG: hypothetical protein EOQ70_25400 [Mesorhizobium sp.]RWK04206.1 MAG: hypothetical protein EOR42_17395 [Mesorhizobium sp.]RWK08384.1 MAG: hypothetical protein EOR39_19685 [Mesorhizobium sp.]RWK15272.1 MAG: hypothetical protein EOR41_24115 [Mesorhizobium sp.]
MQLDQVPHRLALDAPNIDQRDAAAVRQRVQPGVEAVEQPCGDSRLTMSAENSSGVSRSLRNRLTAVP